MLQRPIPRLWERSAEVTKVGTAELTSLLQDMRDTMNALNGAGLAAPQIGVPLRVVIFGMESNTRYPDADPVPYTELINPVLTPLSDEVEAENPGTFDRVAQSGFKLGPKFIKQLVSGGANYQIVIYCLLSIFVLVSTGTRQQQQHH